MAEDVNISGQPQAQDDELTAPGNAPAGDPSDLFPDDALIEAADLVEEFAEETPQVADEGPVGRPAEAAEQPAEEPALPGKAAAEEAGRPGRGVPPGRLKAILEALLFAVGEPITPGKLAEAIDGTTAADVRGALLELQTQYHEEGRGFTLEQIAGGFQLLSRPQYAPYLEKLQNKQSRAKLSSAALETLAIVAYKQPVGRADIEAIRGVQTGPILRMLIDRGMIRIVGRQEVIGRPFLYGTTKRFLEHFGLESLKDLPQAEQLHMP